MKKCLFCEKSLPSKYKKFCSLECAKKAHKRTRYQRTCKVCQTIEFVDYKVKEKNCKKCSVWNKGRINVYSPETKKAMGKGNAGKRQSLETKRKKSEALKKTYAKQGSKLKGRSLTKEHKAKIRVALKALPQEVKDRLNKQRAIKVKAYQQSLSKENKREQNEIRRAKLSSFTFQELFEVLKTLNLKLKREALYQQKGKFNQAIRQPLICFCGTQWEVHLYEIMNNRTRSCGCVKSHAEKEIYRFLVNELQIPKDEIKTNIRPNFMGGLELDIYLPTYKVAIEYHGLAHHSERPIFGPKDLYRIKTIHETKYMRAKAANIKLLQIFEDEWKNKQDLVKSMLSVKLQKLQARIPARKCQIIENPDIKDFLEENHISGHTGAFYSVGLFYQDCLVAVLSFRKPWTKKYGNGVVEIARFASLKGTIIPGAFQKLLKKAESFLKKDFLSILTYADCRFSTGEVYRLSGFAYLGKTKPNYFYEQYGIRESRFKHRKCSKRPELTERQQNNALGWFAIYDAGNEVFLKNML